MGQWADVSQGHIQTFSYKMNQFGDLTYSVVTIVDNTVHYLKFVKRVDLK